MNKGKLVGIISIGEVQESFHDEEFAKIRYLENYVLQIHAIRIPV